jgi:hypothetical protein
VRALRKPTVAAWAVNQAARRAPQEMQALVKAGDELRKAQRAAVSGRGPDTLREAQRAHRGRLDGLTSFVRRDLDLSGANLQRAAQLLRAASVDKEASKSLVAGTLAVEVEEAGFGPLLSLAPAGGSRAVRRTPAKPKPRRARKPISRREPKPKPAPKPKADPNARRRAQLEKQLEKARERVHELEALLAELGRG